MKTIYFFYFFVLVFIGTAILSAFIFFKARGEKVTGEKRKRIVISLAMLAFIVIGTCILGGYFTSFMMVKGLVEQYNMDDVKMAAAALSLDIDEEVDNISVYMGGVLFLELFAETEKKYSSMTDKEVKEYFDVMDKKWEKSVLDGSLNEQFINNDLALRLQNVVGRDRGVLELFVTDDEGALIASSGKTSDFYQGDELWWQKSIQLGKDHVYIGDVEYDQSAGADGIVLALSLCDKKGSRIGASKAVIAVEKLFEPLKKCPMAGSGRVVVFSYRKGILYNESGRSFAGALGNEDEIRKLLNRHKKRNFISEAETASGPVLLAGVKVDNPYFRNNDIEWWVLAEKNSNKVFKPLRGLLFQASALFVVLAAVLYCGIKVLSRYLIKP